MNSICSQHAGKVINDDRFLHTMALTLDQSTNYEFGLIRCVIMRQGEVGVHGFVDKSKLYVVKAIERLEKYEIIDELKIENSEDVINGLLIEGLEFLGIEDPDVVIDQENHLTHVYFTLPFVRKDPTHRSRIYLGHAQGTDLNHLKMIEPVLDSDGYSDHYAKELSLAPANSQGIRLNLIESRQYMGDTKYSTVRIAKTSKLSGTWEYGETLIHPNDVGHSWCAGHVSPGPFLPKEFIDIGKNRLVGLLNGREANRVEGDKIIYGKFSVGLFVYDFELGKVEWVSKMPLIEDTEAKHITFASEFVQTKKNEGVLFAHVDDSFVRAYTVHANSLQQIINERALTN